MYIHIITLDENKKEKNKFSSTISSEQLALMLFDFKGNCFVRYLSELNNEEIDIIKSTYSQESLSVQEGFEKFQPNVVAIQLLAPILIKIRNKIIYLRIKEETEKKDNYELAKLYRDLIVISECIGVLEFAKNYAQNVYLEVEDC